MARLIPDPQTAARPAAGRPDLAATRRPSSRIGWIWPVLCLFQLGLIAGYIAYRANQKPGDSTEKDPVETKPDPFVQAGLKPGELPTMDRGDELVREGRFDLALTIYQPVASGATGVTRDALQYRLGLCLEGLGRNEGALKAYQSVASARASEPAAATPAEIGQARTFLRMGRFSDARATLARILVRSALPGVKGQPYLTDVRYLLALALALETGKAERPSPLNMALAEYSARDWPVDSALDWMPLGKEVRPSAKEENKNALKGKTETPIKPASEDKPKEAPDGKSPSPTGEDKGKNFLTLTTKGPPADAPLVSASLPPMPVAKVLDQLAVKANWKIDWTPDALKALEDRSVEVVFEGLPLSEVLLALTDPHGLIAMARDGRMNISTARELTEGEREKSRSALATQAMNTALAMHPDHLLAPAVRMELAGLDLRAGRPEEAARRYDQLYTDLPRAPVQFEASYNLGLVRLSLGQTSLARSAFFRVVDRGPAHELTGLAYVQIARTHLFENEPAQAVTPLRRALTIPSAQSSRPAAALLLAASYLLTGNPNLASAVLLDNDNRDPLAQDSYRPMARFLDAYAHYLMTNTGRPATRDAGDVLTTLWALPTEKPIHQDPLLGSVAALLTGRAYRDLGQLNEMLLVYQKALPVVKGAVADEMTQAIAEEYFARRKHDNAAKLFATLAKEENSKLAAPAKLRLAEIALRENRPQETLRLCRALLTDKNRLDRAALLKLMGEAYEVTGDHRRAAICFSGNVPAVGGP